MNSDIDVIKTRRAKEIDIPLILEGWRVAYPETFKYKYPLRWNWMFKMNPYISDNKDFLPLWISIHRGKIIGWSGSMITEIEINQKIFLSDLGVDTYIFKEYRKKGLSYKQHSYVLNLEAQPAYFAIQSWAPMIKVNCSLGAKLGQPFDVYYKLIADLDPKILYDSFLVFVNKWIKQRGVALFNFFKLVGVHIILSKILSILLKARQISLKTTNKKCKSDLSFKEVKYFGKEADELWERCRTRFTLSIRRDKKYLNWKFVEQPHLNYQKYLIYKKDRLYGVLIFRIGEKPEIPVGVIAELYTEQNDLKDTSEIINFAENKLRKQGATMIRCGACDPDLRQCLERNSFQKIVVENPVVRMPAEVDDGTLENVFSGPWLMSMGDHDIDIPLLNNQPGFSDIIRLLLGKIKVKYPKSE